MSVTHGLASTYRSRSAKCRCEECTAANTERTRAERQRRRELLEAGTADVKHGTASTYTNWLCRCGPCKAAHAVKMWEYQQRRKQVSR